MVAQSRLRAVLVGFDECFVAHLSTRTSDMTYEMLRLASVNTVPSSSQSCQTWLGCVIITAPEITHASDKRNIGYASLLNELLRRIREKLPVGTRQPGQFQRLIKSINDMNNIMTHIAEQDIPEVIKDLETCPPPPLTCRTGFPSSIGEYRLPRNIPSRPPAYRSRAGHR